MPPAKRKRTETRTGGLHTRQAGKHGYPPEEYKNYLACPFPKHDPDLYITVNNVCTGRWGFEKIGALKYLACPTLLARWLWQYISEHIQRVHSLRLGCIDCKLRFTQSNKASIETAKRNHLCKPRNFTDEDPQWMTAEQELRLASWKELGKAHEGGATSWAKIYNCLFPGEEPPSPCQPPLTGHHILQQAF